MQECNNLQGKGKLQPGMRSGHGQLIQPIARSGQQYSEFGPSKEALFPSHWDSLPLPSLLWRTMKCFVLSCFIDSRLQNQSLLISLPTKHLSFSLNNVPKIFYVTNTGLYFASLQYVKHAVKNEANFSISIRGYMNYLSQTIRQIHTFKKILRKSVLTIPKSFEGWTYFSYSFWL